VTTVITAIRNTKSWTATTGTEVREAAEVLDIATGRGEGKCRPRTAQDQVLPAGCAKDPPQRRLDVDAVKKRPGAQRFTRAALNRDETWARRSTKELSDAMKENGLGTPRPTPSSKCC
jgi:hypothetical protein